MELLHVLFALQLAYPLFLVFSLILSLVAKITDLTAASTDSEMVALRLYVKANYWASSSVDGESPEGLIIGKWFIAYVSITVTERSTIVHLWIANFRKKRAEIPDGMLEVFYREGQFFNRGNISGLVRAPGRPTKEQKRVLKEIVKHIKASKTHGGVFLITGPPGAGKSEIATFLAVTFKGKLLHGYTPLRPGDELMTTIAPMAPSEDHRVIILINEFDDLIKKGDEAKEIIAPVTNLSTLNNFMDQISKLLNVIVIFTSNEENPSPIESPIRDGRIHRTFRMKAVKDTTVLRRGT